MGGREQYSAAAQSFMDRMMAHYKAGSQQSHTEAGEEILDTTFNMLSPEVQAEVNTILDQLGV